MNKIDTELRNAMIEDDRPEFRNNEPDIVLRTYKHLHDNYGRASCGLVADWMNARSIKTRRGNPISRMTVWRAMNNTSDGRKLLERTIRRTGHTR